jgi:peroxiredoxin
MLPLGTPAPDFALPDPAGTVWSRDDAAGENGTVLGFLCNHCPYVRHIATALGSAAAHWAEHGVATIGINSNDAEAYPADAPDRMAEHAAKWGWQFPYVIDATQSVAHAYTAACTPDFFLFEAGLRLVYRGRFDAASPGNDVPVTGAELDAAVLAMRTGQPIAAEQVPSIGCGIKWLPGNEPS